AKYISERQITKRERAANSYRPFSAFITKWLADVPTTVFSTLVFALPLYPMVGLRDEVDIFLVFIGVLVLHGLVSSSLGAFISVCMPNLTTGMIVGPVVVVVFLLYGGPIVNLALIPIALRWFRYVSLITNSTGALMKNEFIGAKLTCPPNSLVCFKEGKDVLKQFSLDDPPIGVDISLNAGILVAFLLFGAMMFSIKTKPLMKLK
ncbi:ATP-binding cassette sub- G member 2, partial [Globomyces sp. JEL0801]